MVQKYRGGALKRPASDTPWLAEARELAAAYRTQMDQFQIHAGLESASQLAAKSNLYIQQEAPFTLAKDPAQAGRLDTVLYHLAESLRIIAILISPVLPGAARGIAEQLQVAPEARLEEALTPGGGLPDGHRLGKPTPLFPRIEA